MKKIKKILVVTASRSEYGLLRWLMRDIREDKDLILQLLVTGAHLSGESGYTVEEIIKDGFNIDEKVDMFLSSSLRSSIARSMGNCLIGVADAFERLSPDMIIILGDRYELLPICSAALVMNIPIAHISGGDITEGAIDDQIRHAVTKMSNVHFPGTKASGRRIIQMGEDPKVVHVVGEPGLDIFKRMSLISRNDLSNDIGLDPSKKWVILTYHPETRISVEQNLERVETVLKLLDGIEDIRVVITSSNSDHGGTFINEKLGQKVKNSSGKYKFIKNLGQTKYISLMSEASLMIGNSSSGIVEAPSVGLPVINIGDRQKGRECSKNIVNSNGTLSSLKNAFRKITDPKFKRDLKKIKNPYGDGDSSRRIKNILKKVDMNSFNIKKFYDR
jgi:UDP-hydrolysing UDP-N-acetyl-D-glucosamine 2-epimerase